MSPFNDDNLQHLQTSALTSGSSSPTVSSAYSADGGNGNNDDESSDQQLFFVTSYSDFDKLAHGPRGQAAGHTLRVYRFNTDGSLVLLHISGEGSQVINPAFSRYHPR